MIAKADYYGDSLVGMFVEGGDRITLIPHAASHEFEETVEHVLGTKPVRASIYNSSLLGLFSVSNTDSIVVPEIIYSVERVALEKFFDNVVEIPSYTAVGNLVAMNDTHAIISPVLPKSVDSILSKELGLAVKRMRINGMDVVGSLLLLTNTGFVLSSLATDKEFSEIKSFTGLDGAITTVNYGNPMVASGVVANSNGAIVGVETTNFELGKVDEALFLR